MKLPVLKHGLLVSIALLKGFPFALTQTIALSTTNTLPFSDSPIKLTPSLLPATVQSSVPSIELSIEPTSPLFPSDLPSSKPSIDSTSIPSVIPIATSSKPSVEPSTATPTSKQSAETSASAKKPNILIILADDVGTGDIPLYWNSGLVDMPNIQRLADMGVTFKDAHSTPLCAPSRYMLLSGNYPHRGGSPEGRWFIGPLKNQFRFFQKSIAQTLKEGGNYSTAMYGKWHLGGKVPLTKYGKLNQKKILSHKGHNWTLPLIDGPQDTGFSSSLISDSGVQGPPYSYFRDGYITTNISDVVSWNKGEYSMPRGTSFVKKRGEGDPDWDATAYNMVIVNETANFIDAHMVSNRSEDPWFIYAALGAVHTPHSPPDLYLDGTPIAGTYQSKHMDMLYEMDKAVGSLVTMIEEKGLANDTIIIFTSDNGGTREGFHHNSSEFGHSSHGPLRGHKGSIYEGGHRVPMIFRYDGQFPVNETRSHMVGLNDIYRTLCKLVGIRVSETSAQDSKSFADYIFSESNVKGLRKFLPTWTIGKKNPLSEAIRFGSMKLIQTYGATFTTELYDLENDLGEESNLIRNSTFKEITKVMMRQLKRLGACPNDRRRFKLKSGPAKGKRKSCNFFKSDKRVSKKGLKCEDNIYLEGEIMCNSICGRNENFCERYKRVPNEPP